MVSAADEESFDTAVQLGDAVAARIVDGVASSAEAGRPYLLGCPGGRTPKPIFEALARRCAELTVDCSNVVIVMMDEYLRPEVAEPTLVPADVHYSCQRFAEHDIRTVINRQLPPERSIPARSVWFPDPSAPADYDDRLAAAGGVDLFIVASGASDGHVAFCGPGTDPSGSTSVVDLADSTRADNLVTFPDFDSIDDVPTRGVTVGLGTIRRSSRQVVLVLTGSDKTESFRRVSRTSTFDPDWPATFIHQCTNPSILTDLAARGGT